LISNRGMSGGCSDWASFDNGCDCDVSSSVLKEEEQGLFLTSQEVSPGHAFSPAFVFLQSTPKFSMRLDNASQHSTVQSTFRSTIRREISVSKSLANYRRHSTILVPTRSLVCITALEADKEAKLVIAAWAAFCLALRVYSCDISVEPGYYAMLDPEATTVAAGAIGSSSARSPFPPAVRPSGLARHADVDQHSAEAVRPARGTATPVSVDTLLVTQLSRGKKALNLTFPINGITIRLCSVTLVSTLDMVLNFGLSGQRAQNAIHSLPPLQRPICHEAIPRGFD
jgi:hypothetical protein